jgi:hypothetical protein
MPTIRGRRSNFITYNPSLAESELSQLALQNESMNQLNSINNEIDERNEDIKPYINQWNYQPKYIFHKLLNEEELYFGAEIEIDCGGKDNNTAKEVVDFMGERNVFCKHDGSLQQGFEIVTHPMTFDYHKSLPYDELFKKLTDKKYRAHDTCTCGLHIHFNRNYFGNEKIYQDLSISNLLYLFEKFWEKVVLVARRDSNHYAQRFYLTKDETPIDMYVKSKNANKYGAINLQHEDTVEIRIYKGTLNTDTFYNTIEFTKVFVELAKEVNIYNIQNVTWENIYNRFSDKLKEYIIDREFKAKTEKKETNKSDIFTIPTLSCNMNATARAFQELSRACQSSVWTFDTTQQATYSAITEQPVPREITEEDNIRERMTQLNRQVRHSRNPMEQQNLQRELGACSRQLHNLRH